MSLISVIMPAYNTEKYISEAIKSVLEQTLHDWELIIVDDCSTDRTVSIVENFAQQYQSIRLIRRNKNSGGGQLPRFDGILAAKGKFVCPIDSDDIIENNYLEKMLKRQEETKADVVLGRMMFCNENGIVDGRSIPSHNFDMKQEFTGYDACKQTIGEWKLCMAGMFVKSELYKDYIKKAYNMSSNGGFSDEIDQRKILLLSKKVTIADAIYYYRQRPNSIVHNSFANCLNRLLTENILWNFVKIEYKTDKNVLQKAQHGYLNSLYRIQITIYINRKDKKSIENIGRILKKSYLKIKQENMSFHSLKFNLLASNLYVFKLISYITYLRIKIRKK